MKLYWYILIGLFCSVHCSDSQNNEEKRITGGGNYGGFIGLNTYGAGSFLVKGKYERDNYGEFGLNGQGGYSPRQSQYDDESQRYDGYNDGRQRYSINDDSKRDDKDRNDDESKRNDKGYDDRNIGYVGYEDEQLRDGGKKNDELEYLGYRGRYGYCIGEYGDQNGYEYRYGQYGNRYRQYRRRSNNSNYYDDDTRERCDYLYGYTGPTANDEPENLERPCALDDWQCIRKYFAANGNCKPAYGPIPDPLYIDVNTVVYPVANITVALPNLQVRGLSSAKIREFYVNKRSGNLVFAIDVDNLNETIPRAYFRYRRTAKESIILADYSTVNYRSVTFTAVIPGVPKMRLDLADIHADVQDGTPPFFIGPGAYNSTDPDVVTGFSEFTLFLPISIREGLLFQSQLFTSIYIQENICDFGLKLISV